MNKRVMISCAALLALAVSGCSSKSDSDNDGGGSSAFAVSGTLTGNALPSSASSALPSAAVLTSDFVYAVNTAPEYGSEWRKIAPLNEDGSFEIELTKGDAWVIAFIDSTQTGSAMIRRVFSADTLDSIAPKSEADAEATDLGELEVGVTEAVLASGNYNDFIGDLGMDAEEADALGELDDMMLRYLNPDIDGDGNLDINQSDLPEIIITFWQEYAYGSGLLANIQDGTQLPANAAIDYLGAAPELRIEKQASGFYSELPVKWSLEWTEEGGYTGVTMVESNDTATHGSFAEFDNDNEVSVKFMFDETITDVPDGTYTYKLYDADDSTPDKTLTFAKVRTFADATVTDNFVFPFPVFNVDGSGNVTGVTYTWMRKTDAGFVEATSDDLEMILGKNSAEVKWYTEGGTTDASATYITIKPYESDFEVTGTVALDDGTSGASFSPLRADITNVAISFSSKIGMWVKFNIVD